jgi:hypothetical protein
LATAAARAQGEQDLKQQKLSSSPDTPSPSARRRRARSSEFRLFDRSLDRLDQLRGLSPQRRGSKEEAIMTRTVLRVFLDQNVVLQQLGMSSSFRAIVLTKGMRMQDMHATMREKMCKGLPEHYREVLTQQLLNYTFQVYDEEGGSHAMGADDDPWEVALTSHKVIYQHGVLNPSRMRSLAHLGKSSSASAGLVSNGGQNADLTQAGGRRAPRRPRKGADLKEGIHKVEKMLHSRKRPPKAPSRGLGGLGLEGGAKGGKTKKNRLFGSSVFDSSWVSRTPAGG